ncbi:laccase [Penicillium brevicompactum]|uniref:Laccase n=1 Tax=Penicillium brevicompactum TaxID=5074 RepID=A0A9W9UUQ8_PENBR|nr:laccase [Penicillium brevicompactum]
MDGVVSVTQCPLAPGNVMSYRWRATQYGTTWYHSHIGLQTWEGVYGGVIINGPASSNYDEDKGVILLSDWDINTVDQLWTQAQTVGAPQLDNGLINGHNVFGGDNGSIQTGYRFNVSFVSGASYRLRVTNVACDTQFKFSIDHHTLTVISMDFVPIKPYRTTVINISIGQRYDVIVQADQESIANSFWLRAIPQLSCSTNSNAENIRGIINYGIGSATSLPNTTSYTITDTCEDEPASKLSPIISKDLSLTASDFYYNEDLPASVAQNENSVFRWYLNGTSMQVTWYQPTLMDFVDKGQGYYGGAVEPPDPTQPSRAVISVRKAETWVLVIIETTVQAPHPIHLHGHDFLVVAQGSGAWNVDTNTLNLDYAAGSLPKRDTALLPALGHLVLAFRTDNPGAWLMHCHIGWHIDQGFALQFVEREDEIRGMLNVYGNALGGWWEYGKAMKENCDIWNRYDPGGQILVNGAGI